MKSITIALPDFTTMSDEEVERHTLTGARDGRWSSLTRWLLERFATDRLELNEAWAETWMGWDCPACLRPKLEIARLTEQGVLLCQLDRHHDHLGDIAGDILRSRLPDDLPPEVARARRHAFAPAYQLIERFGPTLLCIDCNAADAEMKKAIGSDVPRHFSFSPGEIGQFVIASPNLPHQLDLDRGRALWVKANVDYRERVAFAELMAERVAAGLHDHERGDILGHRAFEDARLFYRLAHEQLPVRDRPKDLGQALLVRSRSTAGRASNVAKRATQRLRIPSVQDFQEIDAARMTSPPWRNAAPDWRCAVCARSKFEIVRASNRGVWTASIMQLHDYDEEENPESLRRRRDRHDSALILGGHRAVSVCQDCRQIVTDAVTLVPGVDQDCLRIGDIRVLVGEAHPHRRHEVDRHAIIRLVEANDAWIAAVEDFWLHLREAADVDLEHYRLVRNDRLTEDEARALVIPRLVASGKLPAFDAEGSFDWLMAERRRTAGKD